jgi:methylglutaconyl-CoA hydratase
MVSENSTGSLFTTIENKIATVILVILLVILFLELLDRLTTEFNTLSVDPTVSVIVIQSEGSGAFLQALHLMNFGCFNESEGTNFLWICA